MILNTISSKGTVENDSAASRKQRSICFNSEKLFCQYHNHIESERQRATPDSRKISITNNICKNSGDAFEKVTIIRFNNQVVTIRDEYSFLRQKLDLPELDSSRKVQVQQRPIKSQARPHSRRVTKNLPKNFVKAFGHYLQQRKKDRNIEILQRKLASLTSKDKYNSSLIQKIIDDEQLKPVFVQWLQNHAKRWIQNSRLQQKRVHIEAIQTFLSKADLRSPSKRKKTSKSGQAQRKINPQKKMTRRESHRRSEKSSDKGYP